MQIEILTREELHRFKSELIEEIKQTIKTNETVTNKQFLRSSEVRKLHPAHKTRAVFALVFTEITLFKV